MNPRAIRLHRAPTLPAFRDALLGLLPLRDIAQARATAVLLPTRSAALLLQRTIEHRLAPGEAAVLPDFVTRRDWYDRLYERAGDPPRRLGRFERDVLMKAAAHAAITEGATPPFPLRAALVGEIVALYDAIRRQRQTIDDFERLVLEPLAIEAEAEGDAGAERMLRQSRFLATTFRQFEARRSKAAAVDEHELREWLVTSSPERPYERLVVAVNDNARDPNGLWSADYDLLARLPGVRHVDLVATEGHLATGLLERLHDLLPGLEVQRVPPPLAPFDAPRLLVPSGSTERVFSSRDREDELRDLVRRIRAQQADASTAVPLARVGVAFERPLPYVYLAGGVFSSGGVPYQTRDALPLAAEPFAAALDVVLTCASARFSRTALVALLASPHLQFSQEGTSIDRSDVQALDAALDESDHQGDADRLEALATGWLDGTGRSRYARWDAARAVRAARTGASVIRALTPMLDQAPASVQLERLRGFLMAHLRPVAHHDPLRPRLLRAQQAVLGIVDGLAGAHRVHHDLLWDLADLAAEVRRWIEAETFTPETGDAGVQLVDAAAAPFGDFDVLHLVGLVDGEWPGRARRNIFYSAGLLKALDWPADAAEPLAPARAAFIDLLQSPKGYASVSAFALEEDALVEPSPLLQDIPKAGLTSVTLPDARVRVFTDEALGMRPAPTSWLSPDVGAWAAHREGRPDARDARFHGRAAPQPVRQRSVSAFDLYAQCPFKFFARYVLRLPEERADEDGLTPLERGRFQHQLFEAFFSAWQRAGHGTITAERLSDARTLAHAIAEQHLATLPASDASLERTRLLGSPVAAGIIDVVLRMEAERPVPILERRLEHELDGRYQFRGPEGPREVSIRGIADRIDLLADGTFRIVDYKSSKPATTLQIALYATCARQKLDGYQGRTWGLAEAVYVAFRGDQTVVPLVKQRDEIETVLMEAEAQVVEMNDCIARGEFPPRPRMRGLCATCAFASVCRKDYVDAEQPSSAV